MQQLLQLVEQHKAGMPVGIFLSVPPIPGSDALRQAKARGTPVLVEATSNRVNQFGGYTGQTAAQFRDALWRPADEVGPHAIACGWAAIIWGPTPGKIARLRRRWRWRKP